MKSKGMLCYVFIYVLLKGFCACGLVASQSAMVGKVCKYSHTETFEIMLDSKFSVPRTKFYYVMWKRFIASWKAVSLLKYHS